MEAHGSPCLQRGQFPLGVGAASDPGIKWKKRPNEDSVCGVLAVRTLAETGVPRVAGESDLGGSRCEQLLGDGVQAANRAVYRRNREQRRDAGTTITAALVIGATAYVANVGDSRTYLYRARGGGPDEGNCRSFASGAPRSARRDLPG